MKQLEERILQISKDKGLSHIGSCLSILPILVEIYEKKKTEDKVILDGAHAHLCHLVVREHFEKLLGIEELIDKVGIHCDRAAGCDASGGSLGHGLGIAIGMALVHKNRTIYVIITDGSICEGSALEALRIIRLLRINNIEIHANFNSYTAVSKIDLDYWKRFIKGFGVKVIFHSTDNGSSYLSGLKGHYEVLNEDTYRKAIRGIKKGKSNGNKTP
jgi:transketolase